MLYYLSLGANLGERERTIRQAIKAIEQQIGHVLCCSSFYYSEPWGFQSEHPFCNLCCAVETDRTPFEVLALTQGIERQLGREKKSVVRIQDSGFRIQDSAVYSDRNIDIDIIRAFDGDHEIAVDTPELTIPHKLWSQRDFVKIPLSEICKIQK